MISITVQKRAIALAILDVIRSLNDGLGFLRPYALVGQGKSADTNDQVGASPLAHTENDFSRSYSGIFFKTSGKGLITFLLPPSQLRILISRKLPL